MVCHFLALLGELKRARYGVLIKGKVQQIHCSVKEIVLSRILFVKKVYKCFSFSYAAKINNHQLLVYKVFYFNLMKCICTQPDLNRVEGMEKDKNKVQFYQNDTEPD